jgi:hypothetical protein
MAGPSKSRPPMSHRQTDLGIPRLQQSGHLVLIVGEPGLGKSRLIEEFGQAPGWSRRKGVLPPGVPGVLMNLPPLECALDCGARRLVSRARADAYDVAVAVTIPGVRRSVLRSVLVIAHDQAEEDVIVAVQVQRAADILDRDLPLRRRCRSAAPACVNSAKFEAF